MLKLPQSSHVPMKEFLQGDLFHKSLWYLIVIALRDQKFLISHPVILVFTTGALRDPWGKELKIVQYV